MTDALPAAALGFILQASYRILRGRAVVHLFGKLDTGQSFLVRDGRLSPYFYVRAADAGAAREAGAALEEPGVEEPDGRVALEGEPVCRVLVPRPPDTPALRDRLHARGIRTYEADVRFAQRYLIDHAIHGAMEIRGEPVPFREEGDHFPRICVYDDPHLSPSRFRPELSVLSLDIETDMAAERLLSVALAGCGAAEVLLLNPPGMEAPEGALPFPTERDLLAAFAHRVRELDPDVLTGWNVADFDLRVLARRAEELGLPLELGRLAGPVKLRPGRGRSSAEATVPGRLVLDGIDLLTTSFVRMEDYSLDAVAREILGHGKTITGHDRGEGIQQAFRHDRQRFVDYNLTDARLVLEILAKLELVELAVERSLLTGLPPDRVGGAIAAFDSLYLTELGRRGVVAPTVGQLEQPPSETAGGHVLEPVPGLHENVLVFDFQSLYPSLIRTFEIDPLGYLPPEREGEVPPEALIRAPNGAAFRRETEEREGGILPRLLDDLFPRRAKAKQAGNEVASYAIKILMNSCYGVLGTPACRFYNPAIANAITGFGRTLLLWTRDRIEALGHPVLYGDTDSLFVASGEEDPAAAWKLGENLLAELGQDLARHVEATWGVSSRMTLELETLYLKLLLPHVRHGAAGARKRYAGLVADAEAPGGARTVFTGMEVVRRDWTDLARSLQRQLYERLFTGLPVAEHLHETVTKLRAGELDDLLVYRKGLRKDLSDYTSTTPPHVAAARKMSGDPGRVIAYVMTTAGPEPTDEREHPLDYEHYVEKQVEPVAQPVLEILGLAFRRVIGDDKQMRLF